MIELQTHTRLLLAGKLLVVDAKALLNHAGFRTKASSFIKGKATYLDAFKDPKDRTSFKIDLSGCVSLKDVKALLGE